MRWVRYAVSSLAMHGFLLIVFQAAPRSAVPRPATTTEFLPVELPPPTPPAPKPEPPDPPKAEERAAREPPAKRSVPPEPQAKQTEPSNQAAPVRLAGLGLSNAGFVFAAADHSPVASSRAVDTLPPATASAKAKVPEGPPLVRLADLSERPAPPSLEGRLRANYPSDLERQGIEGDALLRLTLSTDGKVVTTQALSQSHAAFADACRRTLMGSVWSPPRDRSGRAVRTTVDYRCRFRVR